MPPGAILWLVILGVLAVAAVIVLRRVSTLSGRTFELEDFQKQVAGLEGQLAATCDPIVSRLDEIRRRSGDPRDLANALPAAQETFRALAAEGRTLQPPAPLTARAAALVEELDRAVRAADLVEHGLAALLADRGGRDLEAQTSLKRGTLNLRHSREAFTRIGAEIRRLTPADLLEPAGTVARRPVAPVAPTYLVDADIDPEGR